MTEPDKYTAAYTGLSGVGFYLNDSNIHAHIQAIKIQITREMAPIYTMGDKPERGPKNITVTIVGGAPRTIETLTLMAENENGDIAKMHLYNLKRVGITDQWSAESIRWWYWEGLEKRLKGKDL